MGKKRGTMSETKNSSTEPCRSVVWYDMNGNEIHAPIVSKWSIEEIERIQKAAAEAVERLVEILYIRR